MAEKKIVGTEQPLSKSPVSSPSADPASGQFQVVGTEVPLSRNPIASPSSNPSSGEFQAMGCQAPLNRNPVKGWGSAANLPMSERSVAQSKGSGKKKK